MPQKNKIRIFGSAACAFRSKANIASRFDKRVEIGVYLSAREGMFRIHIPSSIIVTTTKNANSMKKNSPRNTRTSNWVQLEQGTDKDETVPREVG